MKKQTKQEKRFRRRVRSRARMEGTVIRPRVSIHRSLINLFVQLIDDEHSKTLVSVNTKKDIDKKVDAGNRKGKVAHGYLLGKKFAEKALANGVKKVIFDRSGYAYHGRLQAFAEGAREGGLEF